MYRETLHPQEIFNLLFSCPTAGQALLKMFELYAHRYAFGSRPTDTTSQTRREIGDSLEKQIERETSENKINVNLRSAHLPPLKPYKWITFAELGQRVHDAGNGLRQFVEPRNFVCICSHVQLGWYIADYACQVNSIIGPTLGPSLSLEALVHIVNSTKMTLVFCAATLTPRFLTAAESCPTLKYIIQLEDLDEYQIRPKVKAAAEGLRKSAARNALRNSQKATSSASNPDSKSNISAPSSSSSNAPGGSASPSIPSHQLPSLLTPEDVEDFKRSLIATDGPVVLSLSDLERLGQNVQDPPMVITKPSELETLVYTSGSTGLPKGAMFTADAWKNQLCHQNASTNIDKSVSWSISDRKNDFRHLYYGGAVAIYNGDMSRIFDDICEIRPHQMNATPAFWNKIYAEFKAELAEATKDVENGTPEFRRIKENLMVDYFNLLGGRVEKIVTGGAPTSPEVIAFLMECYKCRVRESYGSTECGGIVSAGHFVGGIKWKLESWEEYTTEDKPYPRGELCVKRDDMMTGYYADPETTSEALDSDGYYHTGDIVEMNVTTDGAHIIDRKKNIFKLSQGEYVAPAKIEKLMVGNSPYVKQIFVYGDSFKSSLVAVIVPHKDVLMERFISAASRQASPSTAPIASDATKGASSKKANGETTTPKDAQSSVDTSLPYLQLLSLPQSIDLLLSECARVGKMHNLRTFEIPAAIVLSAEEFTRENGLYTQSEKPARHALLKHFKSEIESLYSTLDSKHSETKAAVFKLLGQTFSPVASNGGPSSYNATTMSVVIDPDAKDDDQGGSNSNQLTFVQMGGDSLTAIKLRNIIKKQFNVSLPVDVLLNPNTDLSKIASYIDDSKRVASPDPITADQFAAPSVDLRTLMKDARLDALWKPAGSEGDAASEAKRKLWNLANYSTILLTGATGFLGTALLAELLKSTTATIYCIVRPREKSTRKNGRGESSSSFESSSSSPSSSPLLRVLEKRVTDSGLLGENALKAMKRPFSQRVVVLEGSLELPHFGLSDSVWKQLLASVQVVFNAGAYVNSVLPYHRLAPSNVEGVRTCIELCSSGCVKLLLHVSTSGVIQGGSVRTESALQSELWSISNSLMRIGGYSLSKYIAELLVWEAVDRGYPAIIVRPGFIGSASLTGFSNDNDFDNRLLIGLTKLGVAPDSVSPLITFPVDFLSRVLVELSQSSDSNGQVYHMVNNGSEMTLQMIVDGLKQSGWEALKQVPFLEWQRLVQEMTDEQNPIFTMVDEYFSRPYFHRRQPHMANDKAMAFIRTKLKGKMPATDIEYTKRWIAWLKAHALLENVHQETNAKKAETVHVDAEEDKKNDKKQNKASK